MIKEIAMSFTTLLFLVCSMAINCFSPAEAVGGENTACDSVLCVKDVGDQPSAREDNAVEALSRSYYDHIGEKSDVILESSDRPDSLSDLPDSRWSYGGAATSNLGSKNDTNLFTICGKWEGCGISYEFFPNGKLLLGGKMMKYAVEGNIVSISTEIGGEKRICRLPLEITGDRTIRLGNISLYRSAN